MNIDMLEAGSKLDIRMAELMGWIGDEDNDPENIAYLDDKMNYYIISDWPIQVQRGTLFGPSVSEDSAGIVTDWLVAQGHMTVVYSDIEDGGPVYRCYIHVRGNGNLFSSWVDAIANKRPLAICRAALKARERWGG